MSSIGKSYPKACYAAWNSDSLQRSKCASGGVASVVSKYFLSRGVVYGTRFEGLKAIVAPAMSESGIEEFKGSKYVRSELSRPVIDEIAGRLSSGEDVLFIGTPCQVHTVKAASGSVSGGRLFTIDLVCHGVAASKAFEAEIDYIVRKKNLSGLTQVRFRGNDGHNFRLSLWAGEKCLYSRHAHRQPYFQGYLGGLLIEPGCNNCPFACPEREGDLTVGDFIGLGKSVPFDGPAKNASVVLVNTEKGEKLLQEVLEAYPAINLVRRDYSERLAYRPGLMEPSPRHPLRGEYERRVKENPEAIPVILRHLLRGEMVKLTIKDAYEAVHHLGHLLKKRITG